MTDFYLFNRGETWSLSVVAPIGLFIVCTCSSQLGYIRTQGNTPNGSAVYHRLTQFHSRIHTSKKSQPDLCVFGLQQKTAAPRGKALWCQVKFICAARYHIRYLCGHRGLTTALVPDPARSLSEDEERAGKKKQLQERRRNLGRQLQWNNSPSSDRWGREEEKNKGLKESWS